MNAKPRTTARRVLLTEAPEVVTGVVEPLVVELLPVVMEPPLAIVGIGTAGNVDVTGRGVRSAVETETQGVRCGSSVNTDSVVMGVRADAIAERASRRPVQSALSTCMT